MPDVIGTGLAFPFQFDDRGRVKTSIDQADGTTSQAGKLRHLYECLYQLIQTAPGERAMRTNLGCGIHDFVFDPNDESLVAVMLYYIADVIERWDLRVVLIGINATHNIGVFKATVTFQVRNTKEIANLIIPVLEGGT